MTQCTILYFVLLSVSLVYCAPLRASQSSSSCGVAVANIENENGTTTIVSLTVATGQIIETLLPISLNEASSFFIAETGDYFAFGETEAYCLNVLTGIVTPYDSWQTPIISGSDGLVYRMGFAGYDANKEIIYSYNVQSANDLQQYVIYTSSFASQSWTPLFSFNCSVNHIVQASLSRDYTSLVLLQVPLTLQQQRLQLTLYDLGSSTWSTSTSFVPKYEPLQPNLPLITPTGDLLLWVYSGSTEAAVLYNTSTGAQADVYAVPAFEPSFMPFYPSMTTTSQQLLLPGCSLTPSQNSSSFNIQLFDAHTGSIAYNWTVAVANATIWTSYCEYGWTPSACDF